MTKEMDRLVDMFLLEVGEGRMPDEGSEEREAYRAFRAEEWATAQLAEIKATLSAE
jgi:hypothetical protein